MLPKCDDFMKMTPEKVKITARSTKMFPQCDNLMKMTPVNVKMMPRIAKMLPKCDDLVKMTAEDVKMTSRNAKMMPKCDDVLKCQSGAGRCLLCVIQLSNVGQAGRRGSYMSWGWVPKCDDVIYENDTR